MGKSSAKADRIDSRPTLARIAPAPLTAEMVAKVRLLVPPNERGALDDAYAMFEKHCLRRVLRAPTLAEALVRLERGRPVVEGFLVTYLGILSRYDLSAVDAELAVARSELRAGIQESARRDELRARLVESLDVAAETSQRARDWFQAATAEVRALALQSSERVRYNDISLHWEALSVVCVVGLLGEPRPRRDVLRGLVQEASKTATLRAEIVTRWIDESHEALAATPEEHAIPARLVLTERGSRTLLDLLEQPPAPTKALRSLMA